MAPLLQPALYSFGGRMSQARTEPSRSHCAIWLNLSASVCHCLLRRDIVFAWGWKKCDTRGWSWSFQIRNARGKHGFVNAVDLKERKELREEEIH